MGAQTLADVQAAVAEVRLQASVRKIDPERIGLVGCGEGAELVLKAATCSQRPVSSKGGAKHANWCLALAPRLSEKAVADLDFDNRTCPTCFVGGADDCVASRGLMACYREFHKHRVPAEVHVRAGNASELAGLERAVEFMRQLGFMGKVPGESREIHVCHPDDTARTERQKLWPAGEIPDVQKGQKYEPYLVWYIPERRMTRAIQVVCAGGGYGFCNFVEEAEPVAYRLNKKGMTVVSVKYRCPRPADGRPKHFSAWQDVQRAIRLVRSEAPKRGLDPDRIGVMGFSAGGHLSLMLAANARSSAYEPVDAFDSVSCKVQWACPVYPAYVLTDGAEECNLHGGNDLSVRIVPELSFDADTPPMCFVHGDRDGWASMNSVVVWEHLMDRGLTSDVHTLAGRGHCFQVNAAPGTGSFTWVDRLWEFLSDRGFNRP